MRKSDDNPYMSRVYEGSREGYVVLVVEDAVRCEDRSEYLSANFVLRWIDYSKRGVREEHSGIKISSLKVIGVELIDSDANCWSYMQNPAAGGRTGF